MTQNKLYKVLVIGGGFAGLGAAIRLKEQGETNFALLEKASELGGVWRENTYPGCACDVPSTLYSYSFAPNPNWSRVFARQPEIKAYLENLATEKQVLSKVYFNQEALEIRWSSDEQLWIVQTPDTQWKSRFIILACGPMHEPKLPEVPGIEQFQGEVFHSSQWRHDVDLQGKRVAVIGTGASAIQFVPEIQSKVAQLSVFQRTPHWVLPKMDTSLPAWVRGVFGKLPVTQFLARGVTYGVFESINGGLQSPSIMRRLHSIAQWNIRRHIRDTKLQKALTPNYVLGCKRILQSNDWYRALAASNVQVINSALASVSGNTVHAADGRSVQADVIILSTGFEVAEPPIAKRVYNKNGKSMAEVWEGSPKGFLGTTVEDCPNAFLMFGPNIAVSSSAFIIMEAQLQYISDALKKMDSVGWKGFELNPGVANVFNNKVQKALQNTVWNKGGCQSYFIDRNGRNSTAWPWSTFEMKRRLSQFELGDYQRLRKQ
ncbi:MAG: NAD(P)/FAD-dependent oxidoreductase [Limnobacter sp.]|nr:NAD(P)/FAD-dependent oxidoreductase [Limnobacter sp.]